MMHKMEAVEKHIDTAMKMSHKYIECALKYQEEDKELADIFYWLSAEAMAHAEKLHKYTKDAIEKYRKKEGEVPQEMMILYNYVREREMENAKDIKLMWEMYKD